MPGDFDLSLIIRGDGSQAAAETAKVATSLDTLGIAQRKVAAAAAGLEIAETKAAAAVGRGAEAQTRANASLAAAEARLGSAAAAVNRLTNASIGNDKALRNNGFAARNAGQQVGDFGIQVATGQNVATAFGQQIGQLGFALSQFETGPLSKVGAFLVGPWGIAFTVATAVLAPFVVKLFDASTASADLEKRLGDAASAADSFGNAQSLLGKIVDLQTGKLKSQNLELVETIRLQALAGLQSARAAEKAAAGALGAVPITSRVAASLPGIVTRSLAQGPVAGLAGAFTSGDVGRQQKALTDQAAPLKRITDEFKSGAINIRQARQEIEALAKSSKGAKIDVISAVEGLVKLGTARNDIKASQQVLDVIDGKPVPAELRPFARDKKPKAAPKPKEDTLTDREAEAIKRINEQYDRQPSLIDKAAQATRELDKIIADLEKRKPAGFGALITDANAAKAAIESGLTRPFEEYLAAQEDAIAVQRLQSQGRFAEADALRTIQQLTEKLGPLISGQYDATKLTADEYDRLTNAARDRRDAILQTAEAIRAEQRETDILREKTGKYLDALGTIKGTLQDATQAFVRGDLGQLIKAPGRLLEGFLTLKADKIFENLFGDTFRELQDQASGAAPIREASRRMAEAVDGVSNQVDVTTRALDRLASAADGAGKGVARNDAAGRFVDDRFGLSSLIPRAADPATNSAPRVEGNRAGLQNPLPTSFAESFTKASSQADATSGALNRLAGAADSARKGVGGAGRSIDDRFGLSSLLPITVTGSRRGTNQDSATDFFSGALQKLSTGALGLFTNPENAAKIGKSIGQFSGKAFAGAATGTLVSGVANAVGLKLNSTGSQIGGAIGSFLPIPGGDVIGSILGGLFGGLFGPKPKPGGATVSKVNGAASFNGAVGSDKEGIAAGKTLAGSVASGINQIAAQLGASVGDFNVAIGLFKKDLRVNEGGKALGGVKNSGAQSFGTDEQAAVSAAIKLAISQGAVQGLSEAVRLALNSSTDIEKALGEALKVRQLESLIGGLGAQLKDQFEAFDRTAVDRVRVARQYGLDVLKVEQLNADQRVKLVDGLLRDRISSLSDFLNSVRFGDLFEGNAFDRRAALLTEIDKTNVSALAGDEGAAAKLADLQRQLLTTSREAFGTAGPEFTTDRSKAITDIEKVIQMETDRVNAAAGNNQATTDAVKATTQAVTAGNTLANETNFLLSQTNAKLDGLVGAFGTFSASIPLFEFFDPFSRFSENKLSAEF